MDLKENKLEFGIAVSAFALILGLGYLLKQPAQKALGEMSISYEMPRPKNSILAALFSLGDRDVEKEYINPFEAGKKAQVDETKNPDVQAKAPQKPASKKAAKAGKPARPSTLPDFKPQVDVTVVGGDPQKQLDSSDIPFGGAAGGGAPGAVGQNGNASDPAAAQAEVDNEKMSGSQWRALIAAQPTLENVQKLKSAFLEGDVEGASFYQIVQDLLESNDYNTQKLGIIALEGVYSNAAFTIAARYQERLEEAEATLLEAYLQSYVVSARLNILAAAMKSQERVVVTTAIGLALQGYQNAKTGNVGVPAGDGGRGTRGDGVSSATSNYAQFVPIFQQLSGSSDGEIAQLASQALSQIQVSVASL